MERKHPVKSSPKAGRGLLRITFSLFFLFMLNLVIGKGNIVFHWGLPQLGNVAEFLLLWAASTMLIWAALKREAAEKKTEGNNSKEV